MRREIVDQVKDQVDLQIQEHIPVSLEQQAKDSKQQITEIKISLENSSVIPNLSIFLYRIGH